MKKIEELIDEARTAAAGSDDTRKDLALLALAAETERTVVGLREAVREVAQSPCPSHGADGSEGECPECSHRDALYAALDDVHGCASRVIAEAEAKALEEIAAAMDSTPIDRNISWWSSFARERAARIRARAQKPVDDPRAPTLTGGHTLVTELLDVACEWSAAEVSGFGPLFTRLHELATALREQRSR